MAAQIVAALIFIVMFALIIWEQIERHIVALVSGCLMFILVFGICMHSTEAMWQTLNLQGIFTAEFWYDPHGLAKESVGINWSTIFFIIGMMIMVHGMAITGFFRWLCITIAKAVRYHIIPIFICFMILSAGLAMFIDSITVILFLAAVTVELARLLKFDPVPVILAEVFCANLGGSATMCGDPPNIIIGTSLGYSFSDFILNTGIIAGISLIFTIVYFYLVFGKELRAAQQAQAGHLQQHCPEPSEAITDRAGFIRSWIIFLAVVVLLITHAQTGFTVALIGVGTIVVTLLCAGPKHVAEIIKSVNYKTILFFIGLFMAVGGLEQTGILENIADFIEAVSGGKPIIMVVIIVWVSAVTSALVDNIPFAATMIPVIKTLALTSSAELSVLAWALAIGTDIGGSATPVGASANVVGISVVERHGYRVGWSRYCKSMLPVTIMVLVISTAMLWLRYGL